MSNSQKKRGPAKLCSITFGLLAEWTGLAVNTVRIAARSGEFNRNDIEDVLKWVNRRRLRKNLPQIGHIDHVSELPLEHPLTPVYQCTTVHDPSYNPNTADYSHE